MKQNKDTLRLPPQSLEAEKSVLGGILIDPTALLRVIENVRPIDFYREGHRRIYEAMLALDKKNEPIDFVTLSELLKVEGRLDEAGGTSYLTSLVDDVPTSANIRYYAGIVREKSNLRRIMAACASTAADAQEGGTDSHNLILSLSSAIIGIETGKDSTVHLEVPAIREMERIQVKSKEPDYLPGYRTGFDLLDKEIGGLRKQNFIVIAGEASVGKTAFIVNVMKALSTQTGILFFNFDQSNDEYASRMISRYSMVNNYAIRDGRIAKDEWPKIVEAVADLGQTNIHINEDSNLRLPDIVHLTKKYVLEKKIEVVIVDYLQCMRRPHKETENEEIAEITRTLKALGKELNIAVVLLSQLNRSYSKRPDQRPVKSDLRGSGAIEQDANIIGFLYWDAEFNDPVTKKSGRLELIIAKNKDGRRGKVFIDFDKPRYWMKESDGEFK